MQRGCQVVRAPTGEANVVEIMQRERAVFGGEGNGGIIDPKISSYGRDSLSGIVHVLGTLVKTKKTLSRLKKSLPSYKIEKLKFPVGDLAIEKMESALISSFGTPETISKEDGLYLDWGEYWVHIRPSNTEPILRCIYEYLSEDIGERLKNKLEELLK